MSNVDILGYRMSIFQDIESTLYDIEYRYFRILNIDVL